MKKLIRQGCFWGTLLLMLTFSYEAFSQAGIKIPVLVDHWHLTCSGTPANNQRVMALKKKVEALTGATLSGAMTILEYACVLNIYEIEAFGKKQQTWIDQGQKGKAPVFSNAASTAQLKKAQTHFAALYKKTKKDPKILYHYGYTLALLGDELSINIFDELLTKFPKSDLVANGNFALGDFFFTNKLYDKASREFGRALKANKSEVNEYTQYKLAWIHYLLAKQAKKTDKQKKAIEEFVNLYSKLKDAKTPFLSNLDKKIKDDIVEILADMGNMAEAKTLLTQIGHAEVYPVLVERTALMKFQTGDTQTAYKLFTSIVKEQPMHPDNPKFFGYVVEITAQKENIPALVKNLKFMVDSYVNPKTAKWREKQKKEILAKTDQTIEDMFYNYSTAIHQQGVQKKNNAYLANVLELYPIFIKTFPNSKKLAEIQYYYGELLLEQKQYLNATIALHTMLSKDAKSKYAEGAAKYMVTAAQSAVDNDKTKLQLPKPGTAEKPIPMTPTKKAYAAALELYAKLYPKDENSSAMTFYSAATYYEFGHYEVAIKKLNDYLEKFPTGANIRDAALDIIIYYQAKKDLAGLEEARLKFEKNPALKADAKIGPLLTKLQALTSQSSKKKSEKKPPKKPTKEVEPSEEGNESVAVEPTETATAEGDATVEDSGNAAAEEKSAKTKKKDAAKKKGSKKKVKAKPKVEEENDSDEPEE